MTSFLKVLLLGLLVSSSAQAQQKIRIAVLEVRSSSGLDETMLATLTEVVATAISITGEYTVMKKEDVQALLLNRPDLTSPDCDQLACLVPLGQILGVSLLVTGTINQSGETYGINLRLIDVDRAAAKSTVTERYAGDDAGLVVKMGEYASGLVKKSQVEKVAVRDKVQPATKKKAAVVASSQRPSAGEDTVKPADTKTEPVPAPSRNRLFLGFDLYGPALAYERMAGRTVSVLIEPYGPFIRWSRPALGLRGGIRKYFSPAATGWYGQSFLTGGLQSSAYDDFYTSLSASVGIKYPIAHVTVCGDLGVDYSLSDHVAYPKLNVGVELFSW